MRRGFTIGNRMINEGQPALLVAEIGQAHEGAYPLAHAMIDAAYRAGACAVKFQAHIADAESYPGEPWRVEPAWKKSADRYAYWKEMEFARWQWEELHRHAKDEGLLFIVSPFSVKAVELVADFVDAWKIASGEIVQTPGGIMIPGLYNPMLDAITGTGKPVILSTGMCTEKEIRDAVDAMAHTEYREPEVTPAGIVMPMPPTVRQRVPHAILHCTSEYPTRPSNVGLNLFSELKTAFSCPVGISDHSGTIWPALAAVALGASIVELHVTFSKGMSAPDTSSSVTFAEFSLMEEGVRRIEDALTPVDRDQRAEAMAGMRALFGGRWKNAVTTQHVARAGHTTHICDQDCTP